MAKRKRDVPVLFWVSAEELELIHQKMQQYGTENLSAYLRKMALDGYVVKLDLPELKELVSLMRRSSNNLNQLTRKVHETGRVYDADLEDISQRQEQLWEGVKESLPNSPNFHNMDRYSICGGRNGVSSPHLPPLFLFAGILVFCLSVPDNMSRIRSVAKEWKTDADL